MKHANKHYVIILPTIMDDALAISLFTGFWPLFGFTPVVLKFGWLDVKSESDFEQNVNKSPVLSMVSANFEREFSLYLRD